ncbi:MAG TPA: hypothetical protein VMT20_00060 [Terriglobia bacterium]|nr:hypothetical protein [Terriglobia bacterium]
MKRSLFPLLSAAAMLLAATTLCWSQAADTEELPPPVPDGQFVFVHGGPMVGAVKPVTGAPFSAQATTQITQTLADGNQINRTETAQIARDSSGRTRRDATVSHIGPWSSASTPREIVNISDPVGGVNYMIDVTNKKAMQLPFHAREGGRSMSVERDFGGDGPGVTRMRVRGEVEGASSSERNTESLGTQVMAGVTVEGTRTTETIPAGAIGNQNPIVIVSERWVSPQLQETIYSRRTDPRFGTTVYQLTNINQAEPAASLFQVPSGYAVTTAAPKVRAMRRPAE